MVNFYLYPGRNLVTDSLDSKIVIELDYQDLYDQKRKFWKYQKVSPPARGKIGDVIAGMKIITS